MSFALTKQQVIDQTKTVTRRDPKTWQHLKPGDYLWAVNKVMGFKEGERQQRLAQIEVISNTLSKLEEITQEECRLEGFPDLSPAEFIKFLQEHGHINGRFHPARLRRIEFKYIGEVQVMDWSEYQRQAIKYAVYPHALEQSDDSCIYPSWGLCEEWGEFYYRAGTDIKELGDCYWNLALLSYELNIQLDPPHDGYDYHEPEFELISKLQGLLAKRYRDCCYTSEMASQIKHIATKLLWDFGLCCKRHGWEPAQVWELNLQKLRDRKARGKIHGSGDNR